MPIIAIYALIAISLVTAGGVGGYQVASKVAASNLMQCQLDGQKMLSEHQRLSNQRIRVASRSADDAMVYAMQRITIAEQQAESTKNELKNLTTGRDCLSGDARRVLESAAAFGKQRMSKGAKGASTALAAAAADPVDGDTSTDTDLAGWIASVSSLYEQCRTRVEAIGRWDAGLNGRH